MRRLRPLPGDSEQVPAPGHALQGMFAALLESQVGADGEVLHGSRDEDFAWLSEGAHPSTDVHRHSGDVAVLELALPRVQSGTHINAERLDAVANRAGALDRTGRTVEGREEPVPKGLHLPAAEALELAPCDPVVARSELAPPPVTEIRGAPRRVDDVGEEDCCEHAVAPPAPAVSGQELLDFIADSIDVADEWQVVGFVQLDQPGTL